MSDDPRAGRLPGDDDLIDVGALLAAYHDERPDPSEATQRVSFGTSGHRGTATARTFNEDHVLAISEAVARHRAAAGIDGPLFLGRDTHALSEPATRTIVEVLGAHGVDVVLDADDGATPTPVISHAILAHNRGGGRGTADGIVVTPSHNPPGDGGFKYNPPHGGPADTDVTGAIQDAANELLEAGLDGVRRVAYEDAEVQRRDYVTAYVDDLDAVIDLDAIRGSGLRLGVDPLGGASLRYWERDRRARRARPRDRQRRARPDVPLRPARLGRQDPHGLLVALRDGAPARHRRPLRRRLRQRPRRRPPRHRHAVGGADEPQPPPRGLHRVPVRRRARVGRGRDRQDARLLEHDRPRRRKTSGATLVEVPVGFKWFVDGLLDGSIGFGGEESAGASFLRRDGGPWSTDKDGLIPCLLAAEMTARDGRDPGARYRALEERFGTAVYKRTDVAATPDEKAVLKQLSPDQVTSSELAGEPITDVLTEAPGNGASIGGLKVGERGRLVRGAPVGHRGRLQGLRGVVPRRGAPRADRRRGPGHREGRARRMSEWLAPVIGLVLAAALAGGALLLIRRPGRALLRA